MHLLVEKSVNSKNSGSEFQDSLIDASNIPGLLRQKRIEKGCPQKELAKRVGVNKNKIYEWENGRGVPDKKLLEKIYDVLVD